MGRSEWPWYGSGLLVLLAFSIVLLSAYFGIYPRVSTPQQPAPIPGEPGYVMDPRDNVYNNPDRYQRIPGAGDSMFYMPMYDITIVRASAPIYGVGAVCNDHTKPAACIEALEPFDGFPMGHDDSGSTFWYIHGAGILQP